MELQVGLHKYLPVNQLAFLSKKTFIPQAVYTLRMKGVLDTFLTKALEDNVQTLKTPLTKDHWGFGFFWHEVKERFTSVEALYSIIRERKETLEKIKDIYRKNITDPILQALSEGLTEKGAYSLSRPDRSRRRRHQRHLFSFGWRRAL